MLDNLIGIIWSQSHTAIYLNREIQSPNKEVKHRTEKHELNFARKWGNKTYFCQFIEYKLLWAHTSYLPRVLRQSSVLKYFSSLHPDTYDYREQLDMLQPNSLVCPLKES